MYSTLQTLHSYWAFIVLIVLIAAVINSMISSKKPYDERAFRIALFALIVSHIQLLIGIILYFISPYFDMWGSMGGEVMKDSTIRLYLVEHPFVNILSIALITIGFSKHKKKVDSAKKYRTILIFYGLGLVLLLSRIPWDVWPRF